MGAGEAHECNISSANFIFTFINKDAEINEKHYRFHSFHKMNSLILNFRSNLAHEVLSKILNIVCQNVSKVIMNI